MVAAHLAGRSLTTSVLIINYERPDVGQGIAGVFDADVGPMLGPSPGLATKPLCPFPDRIAQASNPSRTSATPSSKHRLAFSS